MPSVEVFVSGVVPYCSGQSFQASRVSRHSICYGVGGRCFTDGITSITRRERKERKRGEESSFQAEGEEGVFCFVLCSCRSKVLVLLGVLIYKENIFLKSLLERCLSVILLGCED